MYLLSMVSITPAIETRRTCFLILLENTATKKTKTTSLRQQRVLVLCFYRVIETRFLTNQRPYFLRTGDDKLIAGVSLCTSNFVIVYNWFNSDCNHASDTGRAHFLCKMLDLSGKLPLLCHCLCSGVCRFQ